MSSFPAAFAGCIVFAGTWVLILRDRWAALPLGRAASALLGGALMVATGVLSPDVALAAVNLPTLALLYGCMLIGAHMEKAGAHAALAASLTTGGSPHAMLIRVSAVSASASALLTNDTVCIVLTPMVLRACLDRPRPLNPAPFLIAVATSANLGSACSPIGNPQNMLIALLGRVYFSDFLGAIFLASLLGVVGNTALIAWVHAPDLAPDAPPFVVTDVQRAACGLGPALASTSASASVAEAKGGAEGAAHPPSVAVCFDDCNLLVAAVGGEAWDGAALCKPPEATPVAAAPLAPAPLQAAGEQSPPSAPVDAAEALGLGPAPSQARARVIRATLFALPLAFLLADRWIGLSWVACLVAALLCVADGGPPDGLLARVDGSLLLFFSGLFIVVSGFNATGVPAAAWASVSSSANLSTVQGLSAFALLVLLGSNTVSNVPLVLLLAPQVPGLYPSDPRVAWLLLAWISTVAGNLTLLGSVANLIVAEKARDTAPLRAGAYARVGTPSALVAAALGSPLVLALAQWVLQR